MIKFALATILFTAATPVFATDLSQFSQTFQINDETLSLVYLGCGNTNLLASRYEMALEDFRKADSVRNRSDRFSDVQFGILFGKIIAYDNLGERSKCEQVIGNLFLLACEYDDEEDSDAEEDPNDALISAYMRKLASCAASQDVRDFLFALLDDNLELE